MTIAVRTTLTILCFALVSALLYARSAAFDTALSSDQTFFQLVYLGKTDPAYADYRVPALDAYIPFRFTNALRAVFPDPVTLYRTLLPFLAFAYLCAFGFLLHRLIGRWWITVTVPILSLIPRTALASQYWGIFSLGHATHRAFAQPFFVLFFYALYRYRERPMLLALAFGALGIVSALYPTQAFYLVAIAILTYLLLHRGSRRAFAHAILFGVTFLIGTAYYILPALTIGLNIDPLPDALVPAFNEALRYRFSYTFYPWSLWTYTRSIILDASVLVLTYIAVHRLRRILPDPHRSILRFCNVFLIAVAMVTFGLPLLQDAASALLKTRLLIFEQFGESKFAYLPLYIGLAIFFAHTASRIASSWRQVISIGAVSVIVVVVNLFMLQDVIARFYPLARSPVSDPSFAEACAWIREHTPVDAIITAEEFRWRACTERRLAVNWKEGMVYLYAHPATEYVAWYRRLRAQERAYRERNLGTLVELAHIYAYPFIVIDRSHWSPHPLGALVYENARYAIIDANARTE